MTIIHEYGASLEWVYCRLVPLWRRPPSQSDYVLGSTCVVVTCSHRAGFVRGGILHTPAGSLLAGSVSVCSAEGTFWILPTEFGLCGGYRSRELSGGVHQSVDWSIGVRRGPGAASSGGHSHRDRDRGAWLPRAAAHPHPLLRVRCRRQAGGPDRGCIAAAPTSSWHSPADSGQNSHWTGRHEAIITVDGKTPHRSRGP